MCVLFFDRVAELTIDGGLFNHTRKWPWWHVFERMKGVTSATARRSELGWMRMFGDVKAVVEECLDDVASSGMATFVSSPSRWSLCSQLMIRLHCLLVSISTVSCLFL